MHVIKEKQSAYFVDQAIDALSIKNKNVLHRQKYNHYWKTIENKYIWIGTWIEVEENVLYNKYSNNSLAFLLTRTILVPLNKVALENILIRGDNHLTVKADKLGTKGVLSI